MIDGLPKKFVKPAHAVEPAIDNPPASLHIETASANVVP
jgi:hypothetical protein